ncbi:MAG TPA: hypothetical protein EYH02_03160 [Ignisphaera aggregans]|uniref:KaiC domain-containing protein n=1 Tax=Ignisphaera aggregans TaxID=334771 RepID=A0A832YZD0_9CREN|nr:hypothetical protein [Ignisphaera aggregans]
MTEFNYSLGDAVLDRIVGGVPPGSLLVILGHPGAGKTTFAAKFILENAKTLAVKAIYISLAESREKFLANMKKLGLEFEELEKRNLFEYIHIPTVAGPDTIDFISSILSDKMVRENVRIVVIDSITPLLSFLGTEKGRAFLHATLYNLAVALKGVILLIADLPWGRETIDLGGIEFVADAVLVFKTRMERSLLYRFIEIRKFRGAPIPLAEIPFVIAEGEGIRLFPLLPPEEIQPLSMERCYLTGCKPLDDAWGGIPKGSNIVVLYPKNGNVPFTLLGILTKLIVSNSIKFGVLSFELPALWLVKAFEAAARHYGMDAMKIQQLLVLERSFNPTLYSPQELIATILTHVEKSRAEMILLHGVNVLYEVYDPQQVRPVLYNAIQFFRKLGVITINMLEGNLKDLGKILSYSPDVLHTVVYVGNEYTGYTLRHVVWKSLPRYLTGLTIHDRPIILDDDKLATCLGEYRGPLTFSLSG